MVRFLGRVGLSAAAAVVVLLASMAILPHSVKAMEQSYALAPPGSSIQMVQTSNTTIFVGSQSQFVSSAISREGILDVSSGFKPVSLGGYIANPRLDSPIGSLVNVGTFRRLDELRTRFVTQIPIAARGFGAHAFVSTVLGGERSQRSLPLLA